MLSKLRPRSVYDVAAALSLFIALGGTAYAVAANSVGTAQLKNDAVTNPKLAANAVGGGKVIDQSLTVADLNVATLFGSEPWHHIGGPHAVADETCGSREAAGRTFCLASSGGGFSNYSEWRDSTYVRDYDYGDVAYYRDRGGTVRLRGLAACTDKGSSDWCSKYQFTLFYLPPGYRPEHLTLFSTYAGSGGAGSGDHWIIVYPDGRVRADGSPAQKTLISLDGLSFRCFPQGQNGCN